LLNTPSVQPAIQPFNFGNIDAVLINQGLELALDYDILQSDNLIWNANFNIAYNKNELTEYKGADILAGNLFGPGLSGATSQIFTNGQSLFTYNLRELDENNNVAAEPTILDKSGLPDITTGLSTSVRYKNWDASLFFAGQFGHYVYNNTENALFPDPIVGSRNNLQSVMDDNLDIANLPSTYYLEKGDFVRLQSASVSYNFPLSGDGALKSLRVSASGQNLFLITGYSGLDPEVSTTDIPANGLPSASIDYLAYPRARTYSLGVNLTF
jgi:iron complex outermembrane receptor protein